MIVESGTVTNVAEMLEFCLAAIARTGVEMMADKLPAPCEHCSATGIFHGSECAECRGKGYRLIFEGRIVAPAVESRRSH